MIDQQYEMCFRKMDGTLIDDIATYVSEWLKLHPSGQLHIGADSKKRGSLTKYSVSICMWESNYGVHEIHCTELLKNHPDNFTRLWEEVDRAVETARRLNGISNNIHVHVDLNSNPKYLSHRLYEASIGFITSMGFKAVGKPNAWAASCGAHKYCQ